jgi:hypothetical protein
MVWIYGLAKYTMNQLAIHAIVQLVIAIMYALLSGVTHANNEMLWILVMTVLDPIRRIILLILTPKWFLETTKRSILSSLLKLEFLEKTVIIHFYFSILVLVGNVILWVLVLIDSFQSPEEQHPSLSRYLNRNVEPRDVCAICTEEQDLATSLKACGHCFHEECITSWLQESKTCPICRADIQDMTIVQVSA